MDAKLKSQIASMAVRVVNLLNKHHESDFCHGTLAFGSRESRQDYEGVPQFDSCSQKILHSFDVDFDIGIFQRNYVFAQDVAADPKVFDELLDCLENVRAVADAFQKLYHQKILLPQLQDGYDDRLFVWLSIVRAYTILNTTAPGKPWYYFSTAANESLTEWRRFSAVSDFHPQMILMPFDEAPKKQPKSQKSNGDAEKESAEKLPRNIWSFTSEQHERVGIRFAKVLACVGTKGVLRCSVDFLNAMTLMSESPLSSGKKRKPRELPKSGEIARVEFLVKLIAFHSTPDNSEKVPTQVELADNLGYTQSDISRFFKKTFVNIANPMKVYAEECKGGKVVQFLNMYLDRYCEVKGMRERTGDMSNVQDNKKAEHSDEE